MTKIGNRDVARCPTEKTQTGYNIQRIIRVSEINKIFVREQTVLSATVERKMGWESVRERERDLSSMLLQPSFQIRTAPSPENVTFSRSRRGRDGGSEKGGVGRKTNGEGEGGGGAERRLQVLRSGRMEEESERIGKKKGGGGRGGRKERKEGRGRMRGFTW